MRFLQPKTLTEALQAKAEHPDAVPIAGGTDVMVELNFDKRRPEALLDLNQIDYLNESGRDGSTIRIGAGVPYARIIGQLRRSLPGLAIAARTIGSPQIRNRGTVGGNLGAASPAGDSHPPLLAANATVEVASVRGTRRIPATEFYTGPKRNALAPDELIIATLVDPAPGPQQFAKVGTRNAMVIAVCSFAVALDPVQKTAGTGIGSAGPTPLRAGEAEQLAAAELPWDSQAELPAGLARRFGELVAAAARPIDDVRGSARYRRHALGVLARRCLAWAWEEYRCA
ncbi:FAD binding domain-containing protein [Flindersiella endophytica]